MSTTTAPDAPAGHDDADRKPDLHVVEQMKNSRRRHERPWRGPVAGAWVAFNPLVAYFLAEASVVEAVAAGALTLLGAHLVLGFDPAKRRFEIPAGLTDALFRSSIAKARGDIDRVIDANKAIPSPAATKLLNAITTRAIEIVEAIEYEPRDFSRAQKFLDVYLAEVASIADQYAQTHTKAECEKLDRQFLDVLKDVDASFEAQQRSLIADEVLLLDVDMSVLKRRLAHEGI